LKYIKGSSINYSDLLLGFVISVRESHCDYSARAPTSLAMPLDGITFRWNVGQFVTVDTTSRQKTWVWQTQILQMTEINCWIICVRSQQISR